MFAAMQVVVFVACGAPALQGRRVEVGEPTQSTEQRASVAAEAPLPDPGELSFDAEMTAYIEALRLRADSGESAAAACERVELAVDLAVLARLRGTSDPLAEEEVWESLADLTGTAPEAADIGVRAAEVLFNDSTLCAERDGNRGRAAEAGAALVALSGDAELDLSLVAGLASEGAWLDHGRLLILAESMARFDGRSSVGDDAGAPLRRSLGALYGLGAEAGVGDIARAAGYGCDGAVDVENPWPPRPGYEPWELVERCGPEHFGLPWSRGGPLLLNEASFVDGQVLKMLFSLAELTQAGPAASRVLRAAAPEVRRFRQRLLAAQIPAEVLPGGLREPSLSPPETWLATSDGNTERFIAERISRMVLVRSDRIDVAMAPLLSIRSSSRLSWRDVELGWPLPGRTVLSFGATRVLPSGVRGANRIEALSDALEELDAAIERGGAAPAGTGSSTPVGVFVDSGTPWNLLRSVLRTGLAHTDALRLLLEHRREDVWIVPPVSVVAAAPAEAHTVTVRSDGYSLVVADGAAGAEPVLVAFVDGNPLLALTSALARLDRNDGRPIAIRVTDEAIDFGILAHLIDAVAWRRAVESAEDDFAMLQSPVVVDRGQPVGFTAGGTVLVSD